MAKYKEYDQGTDWQSEIDSAVKNGDYDSAAVYEGYRNKKIDDMGLDYAKTNIWGPYAGGGKEEKVEVAKPRYESQYSGQINELARDILNREEFSYNPEEDETYLQYKDSYTKAGKRAMQDTIGDVAGSTGGIASSYATTAGQQAYNNYMGKLADKVPELRQLAYQMYMDDYNRDLTNLGILQGLESGDYSKFRNNVSDYYTDRNYNYQKDRDAIADERYDTQWEYQLGRDKITDERYDQQWDYQLERDAVSDGRYNQQWDYQVERDGVSDKRADQNLAFQLWQILGIADDFIAGTLGVPKGTDINSYNDSRLGVKKNGSSVGDVGNETEPTDDETKYDDSKYGRKRSNIPTNKEGKPITNETDGNANSWIKVGGERMGFNEFVLRLENGEFKATYNKDGSVTYSKK